MFLPLQDIKDPAIPLNYAIFLFNQKLVDDSIKLVQNFEMRVQKLRQLPGLDADPDVSIEEISNISLGIWGKKGKTSYLECTQSNTLSLTIAIVSLIDFQTARKMISHPTVLAGHSD